MSFEFIAVDPGRAKCGLAVMSSDGDVVEKLVAPTENLTGIASELTRSHPGVDRIVIGSGTGSGGIVEKLRSSSGLPGRIETVAEKNSTLEARRLFEKEHPLPWPLRILPYWIFSSYKGIDAYAAVIIGERYLKELREKRK